MYILQLPLAQGISADEVMKVSIVNVSLETLELDVEPTADVQELQHLAKALQQSCPKSVVKLALSGQVLDPESTLVESV